MPLFLPEPRQMCETRGGSSYHPNLAIGFFCLYISLVIRLEKNHKNY